MTSEKLNLTWHSFEKCASDTFKDIFEDEHFTDVTLVTDDNKQIKAHKVILSACSLFFREILQNNHHPHPLLYIKGAKFTELFAILKFVYQGETAIEQELLQ